MFGMPRTDSWTLQQAVLDRNWQVASEYRVLHRFAFVTTDSIERRGQCLGGECPPL